MDELNNVVLVVEDQEINRKIVCKLLQDHYTIIEAENGLDALDKLQQYPSIGAILLDLVMPIMDGFTFMEKLKENGKGSIPVIVMTGSESGEIEKRALKAGAIDFVRKPIDKDILMSRTENAMIRNQMVLLERMEFIATHDSLTGLFNRNKMFEETRKMLDANSDKQFAMIRFDVDKFRMFNTAVGEKEGDKLLLAIADGIKQVTTKYDTCTIGRIDADIFCVCEPYDPEEVIKEVNIAQEFLTSYKKDYALDASFGIYVIEDPSISIETMFTRAAMASDHCKNLYETHYAYYEASMSEAIALEQEITNDMRTALNEEQFIVYLQPKYDIDTDQPCGAEALVRWIHPTKGMIFPSVFIPIFEKNAFIATLDYYMWEHVCMLLHRWIEEGKMVFPISVNMSRVSLFNPHVDEKIIELVQKYEVPPKLLNLEVTESAYMSNPEMMGATIDRLRKAGFIILMDDFGSGYSSLNTLKEINIDVLKLDMKFMPNGNDHAKSEKILSSIIRMAGWLGMDVIAEGVETKDQRDFLASIGCGYVQGYYYAKPMPVSNYEELIQKSIPVQYLKKTRGIEVEKGLAVWSSDSSIGELLSSISAPVALYEVAGNRAELVRANSAFVKFYGNKVYDDTDSSVTLDDRVNIMRKLNTTAKTGEPTSGEFSFIGSNGKCRWVRIKSCKVTGIPQSSIVCSLFEDFTQEKLFMEKMDKLVSKYEKFASKKKMLIVDDAEISRVLLSSMFKDKYEILEAQNGVEAVKLLEENKTEIAAILLDVIMPEMDGVEFLQKKNAISWAEDIPVIVISAEADSAVQLGMLKNGVSDYIVKPFDVNLTLQRVENALTYQSRFKQLVEEYRNVTANLE